MQTAIVSNLDLNPGILSLAMTALRLSVPTENILTVAKCEVISLDEISWHDNEKDCWIVIYDRVYDLTKFLNQHPGGSEILLEYAGRDATLAFRGVGHGPLVVKSLEKYLIGQLPPSECIYRGPGRIKLSGMPL